MAKLGWDPFVTKHGIGHCVETASSKGFFVPPSGVSPKNGKKWPTVKGLLDGLASGIATADWAARSQLHVPPPSTGTGKKRKRPPNVTVHHYVFQAATDALAFANALGSTATNLTAHATRPCSTLDRAPPVERQVYGSYARRHGYI